MKTLTYLTSQTVAPGEALMTSTSLLTQVGGGLVLVLFIFVISVWLFKRFQLFSGRIKGGESIVSIKHNHPLGQYGRLVVVEFNDQWLLLGVSSQNIQCLSTMNKSVAHISASAPFEKIMKGFTSKQEGAANNEV
ncbi:flagellar biosynthetic protein FliO [Serratia fonticola]|uniref:flagellar biosynthetic protein FliO n=1 Tax=Serratia fonticola TaxID=47917 RepID=UPI0004632F63|nr:flagellar biosynthetic protein FliO [Serratia fonticola]